MQSQPWVQALALGNANVKCKGYFTFQASKCIASGNAIAKYCKFFFLKLIFYCDGDWEKERINDGDWEKYYFIV